MTQLQGWIVIAELLFIAACLSSAWGHQNDTQKFLRQILKLMVAEMRKRHPLDE